MNEPTQNPPPSLPEEEDDDSISLLDLLLVLAAGRKTIAKTTLGFAVAGVLFALLQSNVYTAKTTFIPPGNQQLSPQSALTAQLGALGAAGGGGFAAAFGKNPADLWVALLKSDSVATTVILQNNLLEEFRAKNIAPAIKRLTGKTRIAADKSGLISIEVDDKNPALAAQIANGYMSGLLELNKTLVFSQAGQKRLFFEQQLKRAREGLAEAEIMTEAGLKTGDPNSDSVKKLLQASPRAISDTTQQLRARIAAKQIEISAMKSYAADGNIDLKRTQDELESLEEQLSALEGVPTPKQHAIPEGTSDEDKQQATKLTIDQKVAARAKVQDIRFYDSLISLLTNQYEQARLDEAKEPVVFQVVDVAQPPFMKSKPKRFLIVMISTLAGFFLSILWVFARNALRKANDNPETALKLAQLKQNLPIITWWQSAFLPRIKPVLAKLKPLANLWDSLQKKFNRK